MEYNHVWIVEIKIGKAHWSPIINRVRGISGIHYTRAEARESKKAMLDARLYKARAQYRVKKYESV